MSKRLQASDLLKRVILGDAWSDRTAAEWVAWCEDKSGNMVHFHGPMSQSAAKKVQNSPDGQKVLDAGGEVTAMPLDQAVKRHLKPASKAWFSKLPAADKKRLDSVMSNGKTAASPEAFWKQQFLSLDKAMPRYDASKVTDFNKVMNHYRAEGFPGRVAGTPAHWYNEYRSGRMSLDEAARGCARDMQKFQKRAQGMRIGPGGLEETAKIHMQPNTIYYMGASSSPDMVIVTKVDDKAITYRKYPFKSDQKIQRWIGEDLIAQGSKRWLSSGYAQYHPDIARSLKSMLAGGRGQTVKPKDYEPLLITVELAANVRDPYSFVKSWGVLTDTPDDIDDPAGEWTVQADGERLKKMKRDPNITKIVKTKPA